MEVTANSAIDAQLIAEVAFAQQVDVNGTKLEDRTKPNFGYVTKKVKDVEIVIERTD